MTKIELERLVKEQEAKIDSLEYQIESVKDLIYGELNDWICKIDGSVDELERKIANHETEDDDD